MFRRPDGKFLWCIAVAWCCCGGVIGPLPIVSGDSGENSTRGVDEFLASLTQMIGTALTSDARYSQLFSENDESISGRPNRPADNFETGRPPFAGPDPQEYGSGPYPRPPPQDGRPYPPQPPYPPPPGYPPAQNGRPGFLGGGGGGRPPFGPYPGQYPQQNSIIQALSSISQHDDLRCVPRLLCEVSSGTRPSSGYYQPGSYYQQQQQQQSSIPFLTKDALITLLTVLNFVDDSPLLMFGRATLLGYNARGDPRSCTTAYPTCPRDPDQLINYLNNHNGGFFRFFNQQIPQYAPQYAVPGQQRPPYQQPPPPYPQPPYPQPPYQQPPPPYQQPTPPYQRPLYPPRPQFVQQQQQQQYAPQYPRPQQQFYKARADREDRQYPRILSGAASQYYDVPSVQDLALDVPSRPTMTFPSDDDHSGQSNSVVPFVFPSDHGTGVHNNRQSKKIKMVFPDRTGTGGLRADLDKYGNYKGVYYADGVIKFVDDHRDSNRRPSKIRLPGQSSVRPAGDFDVGGKRLPYERRPKFQFPRTE